MRYLAAYLLSTLGGKKEPSLDDISGILSSVGIEIDKERANKVVAELKGKDLAQLIAAGSEKLASVPSGGGGAVAAAPAAGDKAGSPAKEAAKESKKEEEKEESDDDMGFGLFD